MKTRKKVINITKARAIELAMSTNGITREMAEQYTDSELKEVLSLLSSGRTFKMVANF